jgi:hypothetical protein
MATIRLPDVIALLFADDIYHDLANGKFSIMGTYSSIIAPVFPWRQPALLVYMAFTDGRGKIPMTLRLVDAGQSRPAIFESNAVMRFSDQAAASEHAFYQDNVVFPEAGEYLLQLLAAGQLLRERRLFVWRRSTNGRL